MPLTNNGFCGIGNVGLHNYLWTETMGRSKIPYVGVKPKGVRDKVWAVVIDAWENGLSDREAAFRASRDAGIFVKESTIKEWLSAYPDVAALKDFLHSDIVSKAKLNIAEEIRNGSTSVSKWYLERKAPQEFSSKQAVAFEGAAVTLSIEEKKEKLDEFLDTVVDE